MKRTCSRPIILTLPTYEAKPRILPFPGRGGSERGASVEPNAAASDADLSAMRDRLFRMIVANQWDHSHGNRAS